MPTFPRELDYLWNVYHRLRNRTPMGFAAPDPIGWQDVDAFVRQMRFPLAPWEIETIEAIDDAFLRSATKPPGGKTVDGKGLAEVADVNEPKAVRSILRSIGQRLRTKKGG